MDSGSGTEEVLGAGVGDTVSLLSPAVHQTAPADGAEALLDPSRTLSLAAVDIPILRGDGELVEGGTEAMASHPPQDLAQKQAASILLDHPGGLRTTTPAASPSAGSTGGRARIHPAQAPEPVVHHRFSRMAPAMRGQAPGGPGDGARVRGWGLSQLRELEDGGAGPSFDSGFVLSAELRRKEPPVSEGRWKPLIVVAVASVVAVLLAVGGLLFYKYKPRVRHYFPPAHPLPGHKHNLLPQFPLLCLGSCGLSPTFPIMSRWGAQLVVLSRVGGCYLGDSPLHCAGGESPPTIPQPPPLPWGSSSPSPSLHAGPGAAAGRWRL